MTGITRVRTCTARLPSQAADDQLEILQGRTERPQMVVTRFIGLARRPISWAEAERPTHLVERGEEFSATQDARGLELKPRSDAIINAARHKPLERAKPPKRRLRACYANAHGMGC